MNAARKLMWWIKYKRRCKDKIFEQAIKDTKYVFSEQDICDINDAAEYLKAQYETLWHFRGIKK